MAKGLRSSGAIQFFLSDGGSPTSWVQLGEVVDLQEGASLGVAEASNLDSSAAEYIAALGENGLTLTIMYRPDIAAQQTMKSALRAGTRLEFKILFVASGITTVFFGFVTDFETLAKVGKMLVADLTIKMDGGETETIPLKPSTEKVLIHFDGENGATDATDEYGNTVTFATGAVLSTSGQKFGSACLSIPNQATNVVTVTGPTSVGSVWTMECFAQWPNLTTNGDYFIMCAENNAFVGINLELNISAGSIKKLALYLSSNGSTFNIANGTLSAGLTMSVNTNYHFAIARDPDIGHYYVYFEGAKVIDITSALEICPITALRIGNRGDVGFGLRGKLDEFRLSNVCRYPGGTTFTPPASAFTS